MAVPVIIPELQFIDADGHPYAGGTLETYITGTTTPKTTWVDPEQAALNTNPIVLDAAGRCLCWGDGEYRLILRDSAGNLVWDQPATTIVSAAMAPVVAAPTIADARNMLGIDDAIAAEAAARATADDAIIAALNALQRTVGNIRFEFGAQETDPDGHARVVFTSAYPVHPSVFATVLFDSFYVASPTVTVDEAGFDIYWAKLIDGFETSTAGPTPFYWMAVGFPMLS